MTVDIRSTFAPWDDIITIIFFIFLVHLFMQSGRYDDTEDVMFELGLYEFLYLNMLKG